MSPSNPITNLLSPLDYQWDDLKLKNGAFTDRLVNMRVIYSFNTKMFFVHSFNITATCVRSLQTFASTSFTAP